MNWGVRHSYEGVCEGFNSENSWNWIWTHWWNFTWRQSTLIFLKIFYVVGNLEIFAQGLFRFDAFPLARVTFQIGGNPDRIPQILIFRSLVGRDLGRGSPQNAFDPADLAMVGFDLDCRT
jgi:hypothetical protein